MSAQTKPTKQPARLPGQPKRGPLPNPESANQKRLAARKTTPGQGRRSSVMQFEPRNFMAQYAQFNQDIANEIVHRLSIGETMLDICALPGMPKKTSVYTWITQNPSFSDAVSRARNHSADRLAEQVLEIADAEETGASHEAIGQARLKIQARQWLASKYKPQSYGDKLDVSGEVQITTVVLRRFGASTTYDAEPASDQPAIPTLPE